MITNKDESLNDSKFNEENSKLQNNQFYQLYENYVVNKHLVFYINDQIYEPKYYTDMIYRISTASPQDIVYINLNTPGGDLFTGIEIINAMHNSQAKIVTSISAEASSVGAILFLAGDEYRVNPNTLLMFHNYSGGGNNGKGHEQLSQINALRGLYAQLMKNICYPFLSIDEIDSVMNDKDIWLNSEQITSRLEKMVKIMSSKNYNKKSSKK